MNISKINRRECLFALSALTLRLDNAEGELTCALYGFSSKKAPFDAIKKSEMAPWLRRHEINAVFVYPNEDESVLESLKASGVSLYQSMGVFVGKSDYQQQPQWRPVLASGEFMQPDEWYYPLSPNHPELRKQRLERFQERLKNPYIDGIWLDFIRFPLRWENGAPNFLQACFSEISFNSFQDFSGIQVKGKNTKEKAEWILSNHLAQWTTFKIESIRSWVEEAAAMRDQKRKDVKLGFFGVPWSTDDFDNALHRIVGQDYAALSKHVDIVSPMIYHRMIGRPVEWVGALTKTLKQSTHKPVWPVLQTMNLPDELTPNEFKHSIDLAANASQQGLVLFAANHLESERRWAQIKSAFSNE